MHSAKKLIEYYNNLAEVYEELYGFEQLRKYDVLRKYLGRLKGAILDAGAGILLLLEYIIETGITSRISYYVAADLSEKMMLKGAQRVKQLLDNYLVDLVVCDLRKTCFRNKSFDSVVCITVITSKDQDVINELIRISRECIIMTILSSGEENNIQKTHSDKITSRFWIRRGMEEAVIIELE